MSSCLSRILSLVLGTLAKWFSLPHFLHVRPLAGQSPSLWGQAERELRQLFGLYVFRRGFGFGGGRHWAWWSRLTFTGKSDFSIPLSCVSLASKFLAFVNSPSHVRASSRRANLRRHFEWQFWMMADFNSLSRSENSQWAATFLNRVANWSTVSLAFGTACRNWKTSFFFREKYSSSFVIAIAKSSPVSRSVSKISCVACPAW